ncbi:MAG: M24 family metallopeptidase [Hyphomicrobiaceae bacterium]
MPLHFTETEFAERRSSATSLLRERGLAGLLMFAPESHFWICGYDTFGFALFQCLVLDADGRLTLLTRAPDLLQAQQTSTLSDSDIHVWKDVEGVEPASALADLVEDLGLAGVRIGIETNTVGLTGFNWDRIRSAFEGRAELVEASEIVPTLRRVKSAAEIECCRRAAALSDDALDAAIETTTAGAFEGDILAAMQGAVFRGGGDYAGNEFIIGSGPAALLCRYASGRRVLDERDQLTLEWSGAWRRYHAAMMRTLIVGSANDCQKRMHAATVEALEACEDVMRPGNPMAEVFDAHARAFDRHGFTHARLNACGYGMGIAYNPIWVEFPMFYEGNPAPMEPGNVFFLHMILMDSDAGLAMCWGHSLLVQEHGVERLSRHSLDLLTV